MGMISGSSMVGSILANYLFDLLNSYKPGLAIFAVVSFALIPAYLILYRLSERDKKYEEQEA